MFGTLSALWRKLVAGRSPWFVVGLPVEWQRWENEWCCCGSVAAELVEQWTRGQVTCPVQ